MNWIIEERKEGVSNSLIEKYVNNIKKSGPSRVIVNQHGEGWIPRRAKEIGIIPTIILIRNDGWSLGTNCDLFHVGFKLWSDSWIAVLTSVIPVANGVDLSLDESFKMVSGCLSTPTSKKPKIKIKYLWGIPDRIK